MSNVSKIRCNNSISFPFSLQILSVGGNQIVEVPDSVGSLRTLQALVLSDNLIEQLPASIANLKQLRSLLLHKNRLKTLPTQIIKLTCLTEVSSFFRNDLCILAKICSKSSGSQVSPNSCRCNVIVSHKTTLIDCGYLKLTLEPVKISINSEIG